jgi:hypothetical protein
MDEKDNAASTLVQHKQLWLNNRRLLTCPKAIHNERVAKIGRNDPCPCGSGKKFKRCCGSVLEGLPTTRGAGATQDSMTFLGLPAQPQDLHAINVFKPEDPRSKIPLGA